MTDYWEPWQPQVGDRVRFRHSGECRCPKCGHDRHSCKDGAEWDTVFRLAAVQPTDFEAHCRWCGQAVPPGHRFFLVGDAICGMAAAIELELVERPDE